MLRRFLSLGAAALALGLGVTGPTRASQVTFAQFAESAGGNPFIFTNTGDSASGLSLTGSSIPVNFTYQIPNGTGSTSSIAATMTFTALVDGTASQTPIGPITYVNQNVKDVSITFMADTPINGSSNLLTITDSSTNGVTGALSGLKGGSTANVNGDTGTGNTVTFSSDFLNFSTATEENYSLAFSSLINQISSGAGFAVDGSNQYVQSFAASSTGTFAYDAGSPVTPTPEPGAISIAAVLGAGGAFGLLRRRRMCSNC